VSGENKLKFKLDKPPADPKTIPPNPKMFSLWSVLEDCKTLVGEFMDPTQADMHILTFWRRCAFVLLLVLLLVLPI